MSTITNWQEKPLPSVVFFQEGPGLRNWQWSAEGMKVINVTNILGDAAGSVDTSNTDKYISSIEFEDRYSHFAVEDRDIVVASSGNTYGKVGIIRSHNLPLMMNTSVIRFRPFDESELHQGYLYAFLRSPRFKTQIKQFVTGGAQPNFGPTHLKKMSIPVPPPATQIRIADILSAYDDLIENNRRRIALLEQAARELYREWFVRLRFPGHEHVKVVDGVPEEWTRVRLGSLTTKIGSGATPRGGEASYKSSGTALFRSQNIYDYRFDPAGLAFIDDEQAKALSNVEIQSGDVLLNITGASVGRCCLAPRRFLPGRVNQHVMIIRADRNRVTSQFLLHAINSPENKGLLMNIARAGGATREALTKDDISDFSIRVPTPTMLESFDNQVASIFDQQEVLANQNDCLARARDLILPRLMNGSIAV